MTAIAPTAGLTLSAAPVKVAIGALLEVADGLTLEELTTG